jgi:hypothetical protein
MLKRPATSHGGRSIFLNAGCLQRIVSMAAHGGAPRDEFFGAQAMGLAGHPVLRRAWRQGIVAGQAASIWSSNAPASWDRAGHDSLPYTEPPTTTCGIVFNAELMAPP